MAEFGYAVRQLQEAKDKKVGAAPKCYEHIHIQRETHGFAFQQEVPKYVSHQNASILFFFFQEE